MIIFGIDATGRNVFPRNICTDELTSAISSHYAIRTLFNHTHNEIGIVDRHMLIVDLRFAATQKVGQVDRQKAYPGNTVSKLISKELGHIGFLLMTISISFANLRDRRSQIRSLRKNNH